MAKIPRRHFLKLGALGGLIAATISGCHARDLLRIPTPSEAKGPFYPVEDQTDKDFDLTKVNGQEDVADGQHIIILGHITDREGNPVAGASIDIWQANARGRYNHPNDSSPEPLDQNFQGWAIITCGEDGAFRFKTVMPGAYPASGIWTRPPHIHFKISKPGFITLITQMYFPDEQLNKTDLLLRHKNAQERPLMIAKQISNEEEIAVYEYNIVLAEK
mgnify:FL=1